MMTKEIAVFILAILFISCKPYKSNSGQVILKAYIIDKVTKKPRKFISDGHRFWYKDSLVVAENTIVHFVDSFEVHREETILVNYVFFDLKKKHFYEYLHFNDTAVMQYSYKEPNDTGREMSYKIYKERPGPHFTDSAINKGKNLPDTTIDGRLYNRFRFTTLFTDGKHPLTPFTNTVYFDCKANSTIKMYKWLSDKRGCPVVRYDEEFDGNFVFAELTTVRQTLTTQESKAFDAWEKYAKEHPVK